MSGVSLNWKAAALTAKVQVSTFKIAPKGLNLIKIATVVLWAEESHRGVKCEHVENPVMT